MLINLRKFQICVVVPTDFLEPSKNLKRKLLVGSSKLQDKNLDHTWEPELMVEEVVVAKVVIDEG